MLSQQRAAAAIVTLCLFATLAVVPWDAFLSTRPDLSAMAAGPSWEHPLGTDNLGRDLLARLAQALRETVLIAWATVALATLTGVGLGMWLCVAEERGSLDGSGWRHLGVAATSGAATLVVGIPLGISVFAMCVMLDMASLQPIVVTLAVVLAARTMITILELRLRDTHTAFWQAHRALGGGPLARLWRYGVCGAWLGPLAAMIALHLQIAVTTEASLSYLGFGVQEPQASLGNMLASHLEEHLRGGWYQTTVIVGALTVAALTPRAALTLIGSRHG